MISSLSSLALLLLLATLPHPISPSPTLLARQNGPGSPYQCDPKYNAAARKQDLTSMGADAQDLAIAIMESGCEFSGTDYPLGDISPNGAPKTGDAANFGLFKNNWGNIRQYCARFQGKTADQYQDGAVLNTDDAAAITCQHEQLQALGPAQWFQTQRGVGYGGGEYQSAIQFVAEYLNQGHLADGWVTYYMLQGV